MRHYILFHQNIEVHYDVYTKYYMYNDDNIVERGEGRGGEREREGGGREGGGEREGGGGVRICMRTYHSFKHTLQHSMTLHITRTILITINS